MKNLPLFSFCLLGIFVTQGLSQTTETKDQTQANQSEDRPEFGLDDLQGSWKVESIKVGDREFQIQRGMPNKLIFESNTMIVDAGEKQAEDRSKMAIEIASADPISINFKRTNDGKTEVLPGILEHLDGKLKIALPLVPVEFKPGEELPRPKSFEDSAIPFMLITATKQEGCR